MLGFSIGTIEKCSIKQVNKLGYIKIFGYQIASNIIFFSHMDTKSTNLKTTETYPPNYILGLAYRPCSYFSIMTFYNVQSKKQTIQGTVYIPC